MSSNLITPESRAINYQQKASLYNADGIDRIKRHWIYATTYARENRDPKTVALTCIAAGAFAGFRIGTKVGSNLEKIITQESN